MNDLLPDPYFYQQLPTIVGSGAALVRDERGRFIIEKPNYRDHWLLPGGGIDAGEDPRMTARREVREELGLTVSIGRLLAVSWSPSRPAHGAPMGAHFVFDGGVIPEDELRERVRLQASELDEWRLVGPDEADLLGAWGGAVARHALAVLRGEAEPDLFGLHPPGA